MIKVVVEKTNEKPQNKYPYIGQLENDFLIVLFSEPKSGTVLQTDKFCTSRVGLYMSNTWIEEKFYPIKGKITLENE